MTEVGGLCTRLIKHIPIDKKEIPTLTQTACATGTSGTTFFGMDDQNPLQKACHVLQDHWQHIAQHASQLHGHVGSHLQRLRATSPKGERSEQNSAHLRRRLASQSKASLTVTLRLLVQSIQLRVCCRKPAFASISMAEDFPSRGRGGADIDPDASQRDDRGDERSSKKRRKQQKRAEKFRLELEQLSSEERATLARNAAIHGDIARDVGFSGRKVSFNCLKFTVDVCHPRNCSLGWLGEPVAMSLTFGVKLFRDTGWVAVMRAPVLHGQV